MDPIQGSNAVLSFYGDSGWEPFVCTSSSTLTIDGDLLPIRTVGDGNWKKWQYSTMGFQISLGGVMVFNDTNFRSLDVTIAQFSQLALPFRLTFVDDIGNVYTYQGTILFKTTELSSTVGEVVKANHTLQGTGALVVFEGYEPCATVINTITFTGLDQAQGNVVASFTYTGDLYQVLYSVDGSANVAAAVGTIPLNGMAVGTHTITIIPVCTNGFQGTPLTQTFVVTRAASCDTVFTSILIDTTNKTALPQGTGSAQYMSWSIDGGAPQISPINYISLKSVSPGNHTLTMVPMCLYQGNYIPGTGITQNFTIASQAAYGTINYVYNRTVPTLSYTVYFTIYINGALYSTDMNSDSGSFPAPVGATIRAIISVARQQSGVPRPIQSIARLTVVDNTLNTTLYSQATQALQASQQFEFTMTADTYTITEQTQ